MPKSRPAVLLIGHPNSGKTSLFNILTHSRHKTVNYPGSTIDYGIGTCKLSFESDVFVVDTPGIRSLLPKTLDEEVTLKSLYHVDDLVASSSQTPDLIVVVLDGGRLSLQLPLLKQLKDLGFPLMACLSKQDLEGKSHALFDASILSEKLGIPIVPVSMPKSKGISALKRVMSAQLARPHLSPKENRQLANFKDMMAALQWSEEICKASMRSEKPKIGFDLDLYLLHPFWGAVGFFFIMTGLFWLIFAAAKPFMNGIQSLFSTIIPWVHMILGAGWFSQLVSDGILGGIGSVLIFVPQIFLLFFALGLLESSGYLARGAVIIDRPLSAIGLNGKSFVPLLSGCACAIPAMMAARTIPEKRARLLTLLMIPLMTCSARLPVYGLLVFLLFGQDSFKSGLAMTGIYISSVVLASVIIGVIGKFFMPQKNHVHSSFQIELPPWHLPRISNVALSAFHQTIGFCKNAGPIIMGLGVCIWALSTYPSPDHAYIFTLGHWIEPILKPMGVDGRVGIALLLAFAAREVFVSSLVLIFSAGHPGELLLSLKTATFLGTTTLLFTPATILGLIVFFMVSLQCTATVAIARKEMGSWRMALGMTAGYILLAYGLAVVVVQGF
ncbi:MAG: ferrous iron transporter B [Candidatus Margulisbacteria bacterium]|nr:ferrous iron transporter B [Candidatus Margulisiibacteriota bacterium]